MDFIQYAPNHTSNVMLTDVTSFGLSIINVSEGLGETIRMGRLTLVYAGCFCEECKNLMC